MEIAGQNRTRCRTTNEVPQDAWKRSRQSGKRLLQSVPPSTLLELHFSLRCGRGVNHDNTIVPSPGLRKFYPVKLEM